MNEELVERLRVQGFRVTKMTAEDLRTFLKSKGWRRADRTQQGEHVELWCKESDIGISLKAAVRRQLKNDGYTSS